MRIATHAPRTPRALVRPALAALALVTALCLPSAGCASAGIAMREKVFGQAKRDQLVNRVKDARDEQQEAKQQFNSALEQFLAVTDASKDPGVKELESRYKKLEGEFKRSESAASDVRGRIAAVENVANALFREWNAELSQYSSASMRATSERQLRDTQRQYDQLVDAMKAAESKMGPVLAAFKDQVLFLKHNLNARAIASLQGTATQIQGDVERLIREMEASINEANAFISQMSQN